MGYEYHLWKVNSQDGSKDVVAYSDRNLDYSYASKIEIYLPTRWTLSIMPKDGWISKKTETGIMGTSVFLGVLLSVLFMSVFVLHFASDILKISVFMTKRQDCITGRDSSGKSSGGWCLNPVFFPCFIFPSRSTAEWN